MRKWGNDEIAEYQSFLVELHRRKIKAGHQVHLLELGE